MYEVVVKIYCYLGDGQKDIHCDVSGAFKTEKEANQFLSEQLKKVCKMKEDDVQIDIKFYKTDFEGFSF